MLIQQTIQRNNTSNAELLIDMFHLSSNPLKVWYNLISMNMYQLLSFSLCWAKNSLL